MSSNKNIIGGCGCMNSVLIFTKNCNRIESCGTQRVPYALPLSEMFVFRADTAHAQDHRRGSE